MTYLKKPFQLFYLHAEVMMLFFEVGMCYLSIGNFVKNNFILVAKRNIIVSCKLKALVSNFMYHKTYIHLGLFFLPLFAMQQSTVFRATLQ